MFNFHTINGKLNTFQICIDTLQIYANIGEKFTHFYYIPTIDRPDYFESPPFLKLTSIPKINLTSKEDIINKLKLLATFS